MTIECKERFLYGLFTRIREIEPESQETLDKIKLTTQRGRIIGRSLIVNSPDEVMVRFHGSKTTFEEIYIKEQINAVGIQSFPSLKDLILGRTKCYAWKPTSA